MPSLVQTKKLRPGVWAEHPCSYPCKSLVDLEAGSPKAGSLSAAL